MILGFPNVHYPRNFEEAISFEMVLKFWVGFIVFPSLFAVVGIVLTVRAVSYISMRLDERVKREWVTEKYKLDGEQPTYFLLFK